MRTAETVRAAWLMTDYPKNSQTFNHQEIVSIEKLGIEVVPIAVNLPDEPGPERPEQRQARARTFYLKRVPRWKVAAIAIAFALIHPISAILTVRVVLRTVGTDPVLFLKRLFHLGAALLVLRHCRSRRVRHLHAQFGGTTSTIAMLAAETGRILDGPDSWTWSFTLHGLDVWNDPPTLLRRKVASADAVICAADFTRSQVLRISDTRDWRKVRVVRCGIDLERHPPRSLRPPGRPYRVVTIGRLAPEKGLMVLLEALHQLRDRHVEVALTVVGSGPLEAAAAEFVEAGALSDRVSLLGEKPAEQIPELLREADAFCLPSFAEGVPIAIVEAMAIGIPVVSTQVGGIPEMVLDGKTGVCVAAGRADLLAEGIAALATEPERGGVLASAARERVEALYDVQKTTPDLLETIRTAARGSLAAP